MRGKLPSSMLLGGRCLIHPQKDAKMFQTATYSNGRSGYARFMSLQKTSQKQVDEITVVLHKPNPFQVDVQVTPPKK